MHGRSGKFSVFFLVLGICLLLILFSQVSFFSPIRGTVEKGLIAIERFIRGGDSPDGSMIGKLTSENQKLKTELAKQYLLIQENQAFRDQFAKSEDRAKSLLPASVLSFRDSDSKLLDQGKDDGVRIGQAVIVNDNLVGVIVGMTPHTSKMQLTIAKDFSIATQTVKTNALGVSRGQDDGGRRRGRAPCLTST
jgi:rod shape-determining protein MreC